MLAERTQVRVPGQPFEIAIPEQQRPFEGGRGPGHVAGQRVTASEIVKDQRVARLELRQPLVDFEAVFELPPLAVIVPQQLQGFDISGIAPNNPFQKCDLDFQVSRCFARRFSLGTSLSRHTTEWIVPKLDAQVKRQSAAADGFGLESD